MMSQNREGRRRRWVVKRESLIAFSPDVRASDAGGGVIPHLIPDGNAWLSTYKPGEVRTSKEE
jgi:hypothetical protein